MAREVYDDWSLYVVVPRLWKWSSLPDRCQRLPTVFGSDVGTFNGLLDRCWSEACADVRPCYFQYICVANIPINIVDSSPPPPEYYGYFKFCCCCCSVYYGDDDN